MTDVNRAMSAIAAIKLQIPEKQCKAELQCLTNAIEKLLKDQSRYQAYCLHNHGYTHVGEGKRVCCACGWDLSKCQHRNSESTDKFCKDCGEQLND